MYYKSFLQTMTFFQSSMPIYYNYAASISDPVERLKVVMVSSISFIYCDKMFEKPLNPILGETYQAFG